MYLNKKKISNKKLKREYEQSIGKIMNWVRKNTTKPEKDIKQFAINIYNKNKNKNYHSDYSYKIYNNLV